MTLTEFYDTIGGDYGGTVARFMGEERVMRFALKFENDPSFDKLCEALENGNVSEAFIAAHTLKGVCQNLGFDGLYKVASEITEILRAGKTDLGDRMDDLKAKYGVVITAIKSLKENQ